MTITLPLPSPPARCPREANARLFAVLHDPRATPAERAAAREKVVVINQGLVGSVVRSYYRRFPRSGMTFQDLTGEGNLGLLRAVELFDPARGFLFSTYASYWIRQSIQKALVRNGTLIHVPAHVFKLSSLRRQGVALSDRHAALVDAAEAVWDGFPRRLLDGPTSCGFDHDEAEAQADRRHRVEAAMAGLIDRERRVVSLRFGLDGGEPKTLKQVGEETGVTRERVRQVQDRAMGKMRKAMAEQGGIEG